jgi:hypothetical protein
MTIKNLKRILRYYDEDAEVKIIVNTDDVHYNYGFFRMNTEIETEAEAEGDYYNPDILYIKADVNASKEYQKKELEV